MAIVGEAFVELSPLTAGFGAKVEADVKRALAGVVGKIDLDINAGELRASVEEAVKLATTGVDANIDLDLDTDVLAARERIEAGLAGIRVSVEVDPDVDMASLHRQLAMIHGRVPVSGGGSGGGEGGIPGGGGIRTLIAGLALPALDAATSGLSALTGGMLSASSAAISLAGSLGSTASAALTLPVAFGAAAQGVFTLSLALSGVGGALKAHTAAQKAASIAAVGGGAAADTQAKAVAAAERAITSANRSLTEAYDDAAYSAEQSNRRQADAQDELTQARSRARDEVDDLRRSVERLSLSEEQAAARVAELRAKKALAEKRAAQDLTGVTESTLRALERQEALENKAAENPRLQADLDLRDAELDLQETVKKRTDAQEKLTHAEAVGVEGSADVVDALQAVADAARDAERSRVQSARRIEAAEESLVAATERLADAATAGFGAATGAADAYAAALARLSPAQRDFVEFLVSLKPIFNEVRDATSAALLPGLEESIRNVLPLVNDFKPVLVDTATAISDIAKEASLLVSSPAWRSDLVRLGQGNVELLRNFGAAGLSAADGAKTLAVDVQPLTIRLSEMGARIAELANQTLDAKSASGELGDYFDRVGDRIENVVLIAGFLGGALLKVFKEATPVGDEYLDTLVQLSARLDLVVERARDSGALRDFFEGAKPAANEFGGLVGDIVQALLRIGGENFDTFINLSQAIRNDLLPALEELFSSVDSRGVVALVHLATGAVDLFDAFVSGNPVIRVFTQTLGEVLDFVRFLAEDIPVVSPLVVGLVGGMIALKGVLSVLKLVEFVSGMESLKTVMVGLGASNKAIANVEALGGALGKLAVIGAIAAVWKVEFDEINHTLDEHVARIAKSDDAYGEFLKTSKKLHDIFPNIKGDLDITVGLFAELAQKSPAAAQSVLDSMKKAGKGTEIYEKALKEATDALALQGIAEDDVSKKVQEARDKLSGKNNELDRYIDKLRATTDHLLEQSNAELGALDSLDRFTQGLIENGGSIDKNTESGRENLRNRNDAIGAIEREIDVLHKNADAGYLDVESKKAILAQLDQLANTGYPGAKEAANRLRAELEAIKPVYSAEVRLNIDKALASVRIAGAAFRLLGGINITAYLEDLVRQQGGIEARAGGGRVLSNTAYLVGEKGPELFVPDAPGTVLPNVPRPSTSSSGTDRYAYPGDFESANTVASGPTEVTQNFHGPLVAVDASFGPGTNAADLIAAFRMIADDAVAKRLAEVLKGYGAGTGSN